LRLFIFALAATFAIGLAACNSGTVNGTPPVQPPSGPQARGTVISITHTATITQAQMNGGIAGPTIAELGGPARCDVSLYAVRYVTIGGKGEPANASAGFFVPGKGCKGPFLLVGYAQGTNFVRAMKITDPTKLNIEPVVLGAIFAAHGYAIAATDYLGLGYSTYPYQPYLVANSEASAVIDSMRAIRHAARTLHVALSGKVFLTGYSQGGHSIMATQRVIEAQNPGEFNIVAGDPSSGPYSLKTWFDFLIKGDASTVFAYALPGFEKVYGNVYTDPTQAFTNPYAATIDSLLPVDTYAEQTALAGKTLPLASRALMQPAFVRSLLYDPQSGPYADMLANSLLHGWKPVAPVYLCGGSRDPEVNFENSRLALTYFKHLHVKVGLLDLNSLVPPTIPRSEYHDAILVLCHTVERVRILDQLPARIPSRLRAGGLEELKPGMLGGIGE
jgi:pimeloyl-ACP methyl ester carboxylesterase